MARRSEIRLHSYSLRKTISLSQVSRIDENVLNDGKYYYYVKNDFNDANYSQSGILYAFRVIKETNCYHFLSNGHRIAKGGHHRSFKTSPHSAMKAAINRARTYLNLLKSRAEGVHAYLKALELPPHMTSELRAFEKYLLKLDNIDDVPDELLYSEKSPFDQELVY